MTPHEHVRRRSAATRSATSSAPCGSSELLGHLPGDWHLRRVAELDAAERRRGLPRLDTTALLRAVGILAVVATHMPVVLPGRVAPDARRRRLQPQPLPPVDRRHRRSRPRRAAHRSAASPSPSSPSSASACCSSAATACRRSPSSTATSARERTTTGAGTTGSSRRWSSSLLLDHAAARHRAGAALRAALPVPVPAGSCSAVALVFRVPLGDHRGSTTCASRPTAWPGSSCSAGSSTARRRRPTKLLTTALCLLTIPGFFGRPEREWFIALGIVLLVWCREVPLPARRHPADRRRRRGEHGDLPQPLPDLAAARPQPAGRRRLRADRSSPASPSGRRARW